MSEYRIPKDDEIVVGAHIECLSGFTDGTVKTIEDYNNSIWNKLIINNGDLPYIYRALHGKNRENGLCGVRIKI